MNAKIVFRAAKVSARLEQLIPCFQRETTKNGEPLSEATLNFNKSVADALQQASEIIEALLSEQ